MARGNSRISVDIRIDFDDCSVVLLKPSDGPLMKNNVFCIDPSGHELWNIKDIIKYPQPDYEDAYVALSKESDHTFSLISFGGLYFVINIDTLKIEEKHVMRF
ncbi:MAG: hypothetical protein ACOYIK_08370 [Coriobacteriales bacterium]